jgi:hypothetical protein
MRNIKLQFEKQETKTLIRIIVFINQVEVP